MFHGHLDYFQKPPLGGRPNTKPGDHGTPNAHNRWFILFYHVWGPAWIEIHWNSIWLRARSHMTSHYTWGSVTTLHDVGGVFGTAFGHFHLGSHNFMVTALGSCVKWPLVEMWTYISGLMQGSSPLSAGPTQPKPRGWGISRSFKRRKYPPRQWSGRLLGIIGWDPSVFKTNRFHVDILWCPLLNWGIFYKFL